MTPAPLLKATHKSIKAYYERLKEIHDQGASHEGAVREAFKDLLHDAARLKKWVLLTETSLKVKGGTVRPDAILQDEYYQQRGYWEAKDTDDDLEAEIQKKIAKGYPLKNTIFEDTRRAVLFQNGDACFRADLHDPQQAADLLNLFLSHSEPAIEDFERAVGEFKERIPQLAKGLDAKIKLAHRENKTFQAAYDSFYELARNALNPNLSADAVDEMLIQHLLTERLIREIFNNPDFVRKNVIAAELEKVVDALTSQHFDRTEFLKQLNRFYVAIENAARMIESFTEKQHFLNTVYERFFQGYSVKVADTHGIVYTPQEIVEFMCAAVEEVLREEFGAGLGDEGVNILDPATGTGSFIVHLLRRTPREKLEQAYRHQMFANEVMLMPYYIASLNIEHEYYELTGTYEPFEGLCFVDTLDLAAADYQPELPYFAEKNAERVQRQKKTPITVIIANPPYNVGQLNENDNNKNRLYDLVDRRVGQTYARSSRASNKRALYDPYVKFFRWATDRLRTSGGIVCFVSNNSFVDQVAFDGMRKHLAQDFTTIYHIDLHGNVRQNPKLSGTTHNVFGIQVGVGITLAVRVPKKTKRHIFYSRVPEQWRKEQKLNWLAEQVTSSSSKPLEVVKWEKLLPDEHHTWLIDSFKDQYADFIPIGSKQVKLGQKRREKAFFRIYSRGLETTRDAWVYDFNIQSLATKVRKTIDTYNGEVDRWERAGRPKGIDGFVNADSKVIKWSSRLKETLQRRQFAEYDSHKLRKALYRPFTRQYVFFDSILNHRQGVLPHIFPKQETEQENLLIWLKVGSEWPMFALISNTIVDLLPQGGSQCFPFYVYDVDGSNRRENITDWGFHRFQKHYHDDAITKEDIFYYVYGVLHHPGYRSKYADNLKRELPHIPFAPDFRAFSEAGRKLATLHLEYEQMPEYRLDMAVDQSKPLSYRVEKMRLSKDKTALKVNDSITLRGIPEAAFDYRLGNRSALEWVIDQYQVKEDKRSGIVSDPNNPDDPKYIVRLVGQVIQVSVETAKIVKGLPEDFGG